MAPTRNPAVGKGTHGFEAICWLLQLGRRGLVALYLVTTWITSLALFGGGIFGFIKAALLVPIIFPVLPVVVLITMSQLHDGGKVDWSSVIEIDDENLHKKWAGKKIPYTIAIEMYMSGILNFKVDPYTVFIRRRDYFCAKITWHDVKHYATEMVKQNINHGKQEDREDVATVYDRGNDFYGWFLGERMKYSSGIFRSQEDSLEDAQDRMLDLVCKQAQMKEGMTHFDFGCGWGTLVCHAAKNFGTTSFGITLSDEQRKAAEQRKKDYGVEDKVHIMVKDYRDVELDTTLPKQFDVITCLEMAEHVGIKNFQQFLLQVRRMLKPNGIFYLQIAGLRRAWQYEDLVWGLFMNKYIFPAADASCPLGFVTTHLERAGWEVHRVENAGVHYSLTIKHWYDNWTRNEKAIVDKYGSEWFRKWVVFLGWSTIVAAQGSSTVFMITNTINHAVDEKTVPPGEAEINRMEKWVGEDVVGLQQ